MMKKTILLCLLLSAGALLRGQNVKVNVSGTAADKTRMVYLYDDMRMEKVIDSIATRNGKWSFNQERPLNSLLLASTARPQTDSSQENTVVFFADEATTTVDLDACQVEGSRQSTEANRAFQGLVTCARSSMQPQSGNVDWKMKALSIMRNAVMDNLDNMVGPGTASPRCPECVPERVPGSCGRNQEDPGRSRGTPSRAPSRFQSSWRSGSC